MKHLLKRLLPARPPRPGLELADGTLASPGAVPLNADVVDVRTLQPCTCGREGIPDGWRHQWPTDSIGWQKADPGCPRYRPLADELAVREQLRVAARAEESAGVVAGPAATAYRQHMDRLLGREGLGLPARSEVAVLPARTPRHVDTGPLRSSLPASTPEHAVDGTCSGTLEVRVWSGGMAVTAEQLRRAAPTHAERQPMRPTYDPSLQDSILK